MTESDLERLAKLRPLVTNVLGFYELLYDATGELTPYERMTKEAHFAASSHALAVELVKWIDDLQGYSRTRGGPPAA